MSENRTYRLIPDPEMLNETAPDGSACHFLVLDADGRELGTVSRGVGGRWLTHVHDQGHGPDARSLVSAAAYVAAWATATADDAETAAAAPEDDAETDAVDDADDGPTAVILRGYGFNRLGPDGPWHRADGPPEV
ncbi:hypothetical protein HDA32_000128 [Spinactinospora alkalitolerans]|uniref:Uncharacterized protein n=1 Tax=Spinactinospora alkalitolerans TaxID=687207 RepID=A0A852TM46_9ACTN|nr:hypothetical protein [Spinactinospora alkalitolerans]NYE45008.1 hypothetical protein [Spinactinospora alkalitolerans]